MHSFMLHILVVKEDLACRDCSIDHDSKAE